MKEKKKAWTVTTKIGSEKYENKLNGRTLGNVIDIFQRYAFYNRCSLDVIIVGDDGEKWTGHNDHGEEITFKQIKGGTEDEQEGV